MTCRNIFTSASGSRRHVLEELRKASAPGQSTVFISHKGQDIQKAKEIAEELMALEVNDWLDVDDAETQQAFKVGDDEAMALAIERGIAGSTHLLALITSKTRISWWVPFEIGTARGRAKPLCFFIDKEVTDPPEYKALGIVVDKLSVFRAWATSISGACSLTESANQSRNARFLPIDRLLKAG